MTSSAKRMKDLAKKVSEEIGGLVLAHAYIVVKSAGLSFKIFKLDNETYQQSADKDPHRINVEVRSGIVRKAWVG